jgi:type 1 fimbria pilin
MKKFAIGLGIVSVLGVAALVFATAEPTPGDYTIHNSSGAQTGTCEFVEGSTPLYWNNNDQEDIFFLDPPNCRYVSPVSNTEIKFTDNGDGSYNFTQRPKQNSVEDEVVTESEGQDTRVPQPAPGPKPVPRFLTGKVISLG